MDAKLWTSLTSVVLSRDCIAFLIDGDAASNSVASSNLHTDLSVIHRGCKKRPAHGVLGYPVLPLTAPVNGLGFGRASTSYAHRRLGFFRLGARLRTPSLGAKQNARGDYLVEPPQHRRRHENVRLETRYSIRLAGNRARAAPMPLALRGAVEEVARLCTHKEFIRIVDVQIPLIRIL